MSFPRHRNNPKQNNTLHVIEEIAQLNEDFRTPNAPKKNKHHTYELWTTTVSAGTNPVLKLFAKALLCAKLQHYLHLTSRWIRIFSRHTTWLFPCHKVRRSCKIRKIKELQKQRALPFLSATSSAVTQPSRPNFPSSVTTRSTIRRRN